MTSFVTCILAHLAGDYLFQTEFEAMNKALGSFWNRALLAHCMKYTLCFVPAFWLAAIPMPWLVVVFGTHMFFDRRWPIIAWRKHVMRGTDQGIRNTFWLTIVVDQIFHVLVLAAILYRCM